MESHRGGLTSDNSLSRFSNRIGNASHKLKAVLEPNDKSAIRCAFTEFVERNNVFNLPGHCFGSQALQSGDIQYPFSFFRTLELIVSTQVVSSRHNRDIDIPTPIDQTCTSTNREDCSDMEEADWNR